MTDSLYSRGEFVKGGYLVKSPPLNRALVSQWHRRWFVLMDSRLVYPLAERYVRLMYYQSEADAKRLADPKGSINLNSCLSVVTLNESIKNYKFVFDVCTSERVYHLAADNEEERLEWVTTLKELLFGHQQANGVSSNLQPGSDQQRSPEVQRRARESPKLKRPSSYTGSTPTSEIKSRASVSVQSRPLPPVPNNSVTSVLSSPVERRNRPLPATPESSQPVHIHPVGLQTSPLPVKKKTPPPRKPMPYKAANKSTNDAIKEEASSCHVPRAASLSPPPQQLVAEDYQEFVFQPANIDNCDIPEDNYSLATDATVPRPSQQVQRRSTPNSFPVQISSSNEDYSVLSATVVTGYDPKNEDYSHLESTLVTDSPPPPVRHSSLAPHLTTDKPLQKPQPKARTKPPQQRPRSAIPDYVNCPSPSPTTDDDYSRLHH